MLHHHDQGLGFLAGHRLSEMAKIRKIIALEKIPILTVDQLFLVHVRLVEGPIQKLVIRPDKKPSRRSVHSRGYLIPFWSSPLIQLAKSVFGRSSFIVTPASVRFAIQSNCGESFTVWSKRVSGMGNKA